MERLSELRDELLGQHRRLRTLAAEVRAAIEAPSPGAAPLSARIRTLGSELEAHNRREATLLGGVIPDIDAWGEIRAAKMDELHLQEHQELQQALSDCATDDLAQARKVLPVIDKLLSHMQEEERAFLNANVLRDDIINVGQSGG